MILAKKKITGFLKKLLNLPEEINTGHMDCRDRLNCCCSSFREFTIIKKLVTGLRHIPIIQPSSKFKWIWDIFYFIVILINLYIIPIHVCFDTELK